MKITIQITLEMEEDRARDTTDDENSPDQHDADREDPKSGAHLVSSPRERHDPQGNRPVSGREEATSPLSGEIIYPSRSRGRGDSRDQERVGPDQDPTGETKPYAEHARVHEARKAEMEERVRELEAKKQKAEVQRLFEEARALRDKGFDYGPE